MKKAGIVLLMVIMIFAVSCGKQGGPEQGGTTFPATGEVPVNEKTVRFLGRYFESDGAYYTNMSCAGFEVNFEGTELKAVFRSKPSDAEHNTYIHVFIDDNYESLDAVTTKGTDDSIENDSRILLEEGESTVVLASGLEPGKHKITVQKANQSSLNQLGTVKLLPGDGAILEPPAERERSILVIGDSITCGSNNLGAEDPASYSKSEDGLITMAAIAARNLNSDIEVFAKNGLYTNVIVSAAEKNYLYYVDPFNSIFENWDAGKPERRHDLVIINLGINDTNVINTSGGTYTKDQLQKDYISLLQTVRALYPESYILCTDMSASANVEKAAVSQYQAETGDERISFYKRSVAYGRHPLISVHKSEAKQLVKKIEKLNIFSE